jgi:hypothetical protein
LLHLVAAIAIAMALLCATTLIHWESLSRLTVVVERAGHLPRHTVVLVIVALVTAHIAEIALYAAGYVVASRLAIGSLTSVATAVRPLHYFYFSAETYSTLGYGDILPAGEIRFIASIEPLNGLMLLAWSGSFLFDLVQRVVARRRAERGQPPAFYELQSSPEIPPPAIGRED